MLTAKGHRIQIVGNGRAAVEAVKRETFDLILMDNQMPELSGIEATRIIRGLGFNLPIVAVTASTHAADRDLLLSAGMNEFVAKPFTLAELQAAISRAGRQSVAKAPASRHKGDRPNRTVRSHWGRPHRHRRT